MPYRRLPNTDQARVRALKQVVAKESLSNVYDMAISLKTLTEARNFLKRFEAAQGYYQLCYENQAKASRKHQANAKAAKLYLSHFIQVLNMSIVRSEIKKTNKELYGLPTDNYSVPDLSTEAALVDWGAKVILGEQKRMSLGGAPIYNPTIAKVKVRYDIFMESYEKQKDLQQITARSLDEITSMRSDADKIILDIWNQVEKNFENVQPNDLRLAKCREYGLVYYYRANEKQ